MSRRVVGRSNRLCLARFLPNPPHMSRSNTSTDPLIEILSLCEQALTELHTRNGAAPNQDRSHKLSHLRKGKRANITHRLVLIPGGLSVAQRRDKDR
jgi:hypothetical protein